MRTAIFTGAFYNPNVTQIVFHIDNLFGGDTVILSQKPSPDLAHGRPHFAWEPRKGDKRSLGMQISAGVQKIRGLYDYRTVRVPYGKRRRDIIAFLRAEKIEAVLAEFGTSAMRLAPVAREAGLPMFAYFRGADATLHLRYPLRIEAYRRMMPNLTGVFSVSQFLLDNLAARGISHPQSFVVPSGVDTSRFTPVEKRPGSFLAVGRFIEKKRPDITLRAFSAAARRHPEARLEMIGDGPMLDPCREIAAKAGLADRVIFHGLQPHDAVRERLAECEVFLQHSVTGADGNAEGLPTSIQEAMACGCVVISTRHAGIPEAVAEGETGYLVDEGDEAGFADRISDAMELGPRLPIMSARAREVACARFDNRKLIRFVEEKMIELSR